MRVSFKNGVFVFESTYAEKDAVKAAGAWWHGGNCRPGCKACDAKLPLRVWWTPKQEVAARLSQYADKDAKEALAGHVETVAASRATDANIDVPCPDGLAYLPYQKAGIAYAMRRPRVLIGDEMGLGKTIQLLGIINADPSIKNVLIVCPASLRLNWQREAQKWLVRPFTFHVVNSSDPPPADATFVIVGYPRISGKAGQVVFGALMARQWDLVGADECHYVKNPSAQRTVALLGAGAKRAKGSTPAKEASPGLISRSRRAVFMTGTPILNRPIEIHPLLQALDPASWGNFFAFAKRYCDAHQVQAGRKLVWDFKGASHLDELQEKLRSTVMVRRLKKDVLTDLPPKRRQIVTLELNGAAEAVRHERAAWERFEDELARLRLEADLAHAAGDKEAYEAAVSALTQAQRLAFTEISKERHNVAVSKIPACIDHIKGILEADVPKVIVMAHHHDVIHALAAEFGDEAVTLTGETPMADRQAAVDRFQTDPTCRVFIGSITAAGVGLTLTAASTVIFCELDWVPGNVSQAEDRAHRIGQRDSVLIQHLVLDGSLDARMAEVIVDKQNIADAALDNQNLIKVPALPSDKGKDRPSKYPQADDIQRHAAAAAMKMLAGMCDGAHQLDGSGFNKLDAAAGHRLAALQRPMTDGEVWFAKKLANKYRRQLTPDICAALGIVK